MLEASQVCGHSTEPGKKYTLAEPFLSGLQCDGGLLDCGTDLPCWKTAPACSWLQVVHSSRCRHQAEYECGVNGISIQGQHAFRRVA